MTRGTKGACPRCGGTGIVSIDIGAAIDREIARGALRGIPRDQIESMRRVLGDALPPAHVVCASSICEREREDRYQRRALEATQAWIAARDRRTRSLGGRP